MRTCQSIQGWAFQGPVMRPKGDRLCGWPLGRSRCILSAENRFLRQGDLFGASQPPRWQASRVTIAGGRSQNASPVGTRTRRKKSEAEIFPSLKFPGISKEREKGIRSLLAIAGGGAERDSGKKLPSLEGSARARYKRRRGFQEDFRDFCGIGGIPPLPKGARARVYKRKVPLGPVSRIFVLRGVFREFFGRRLWISGRG